MPYRDLVQGLCNLRFRAPLLHTRCRRRDFTVNALYYDPQDNTLRDYFNGIDDLKNGKLRLIGDPVTRYQEDPVRMLRSVRFMAKLDMFLEKPSEQPIRELAPLLKIFHRRVYSMKLKIIAVWQWWKNL